MDENNTGGTRQTYDLNDIPTVPKERFKWAQMTVLVLIAVICLGAVYIWQNKKPEITQIPNLEVLPTPEEVFPTDIPVPEDQPGGDALVAPTSSTEDKYKIYRNEKYGFEFQYPAEWKIMENEDRKIKLGATDTEFTINIYPMDASRGNECSKLINTEEFKIENHDVKIDTFKEDDTGEICNGLNLDLDRYTTTTGFSKNDSELYEFFFVYKKYEYINVFKKVLSSFKFLNTSNIPNGWKEYRNNDFRLTLPEGWDSEETSEGVTFRDKKNSVYGSDSWIGFSVIKTQDNHEQFLVKHLVNDGVVDNSEAKPEQIKIGGYDGTKIITGNAMGVDVVWIFIPRNNSNYIISTMVYGDEVTNKLIEQIWSTIEFQTSSQLQQQIEDYSSSEEKIGLKIDICEGESSLTTSFKKELEKRQYITKKVGGVRILYIDNFSNLSKVDFLKVEDCQAGGVNPLTIIDNKLVWIGSCSSGVESEAAKQCEETFKEIESIYK